jgi:transposase-like protein
MAEPSSPSSPFRDSSPDSPPPPPSPERLAAPDANAARDAQGHFTQAFKLAAVRYAAACGKSQRAAALDIGISDGTLADWSRDARPIPAATATATAAAAAAGKDGVIDVQRFDELAQLRSQNRELLARNLRLTAERDFLKKCASYFASPTPSGSK